MTTGKSNRTSGEPLTNPMAAEKDFEQNLRRLDQLANLGVVSASVAHEIKNGLVAINTFVELLLQKGEDRELSETVRRELSRIDTLVTQMLRLAAPQPAATATVHVHELLDYALRLLQHQMGGKLIQVHRRYQAQPDTVRGDESQLQQAFMNLLINAVEAMGTNGELTVTTEITGGKPEDRRLRLHIQDTGVGIPPQNLTRLFEPFFTTKKNGTGLGLAICRRIVHEHNGEITARSEVKKGATFSLSLPAV